MQNAKASHSNNQITQEKLDLARAYIRHSPRAYISRVMGDRAWSAQLRILESIRDHKHTCVPSCHAAGKDWIAARAVPWFLQAFGPDCMVITTAPTDRQVKNILWREIATAYRDSIVPLPGKLLTQEIRISSDWYAIGFTATDYDPNKFSGWHALNILIVLDEASGISRAIRDAISGNLSAGAVTRQFEIGNPIDPASEFRKESESPRTNTIHLSAFDTPNFTEFGLIREDFDSDDWLKKIDNAELPAPWLISPEWVADQVQKYGWDDPFVVSRVLGAFPSASPDTLIDHNWIENARDYTAPTKKREPRILACDVARYGDDYTIIGLREGQRYRTLRRAKKQATTTTAGQLIWLWKKEKATSIRVDADGIGGGVVDILEEEGAPVVPMHGSAKPSEEGETRYHNARAEWHWDTREEFRLGRIDIDDKDQELVDQAKQVRIAGYRRGRILIEDKDEYKKRVGYSPDDWDTLMYAFANVPEIPVQVYI